MNALVTFRTNGLGQMSPTPAQRTAAREEITSNLRAKALAMLRKMEESQKSATGTAPKSVVPEQELGRDAFLHLLVLQMQHQDPLDPVDNTDMIAQLAQFSSLEQMNNLNDSFAGLSDQFEYFSGNLDQLNFISAQGLLGKYVNGITPTGEAITGKVEGVQLSGSIVVLTVDGQQLPMTGVMAVGSEPFEEPPASDDGDSEQESAE